MTERAEGGEGGGGECGVDEGCELCAAYCDHYLTHPVVLLQDEGSADERSGGGVEPDRAGAACAASLGSIKVRSQLSLSSPNAPQQPSQVMATSSQLPGTATASSPTSALDLPNPAPSASAAPPQDDDPLEIFSSALFSTFNHVVPWHGDPGALYHYTPPPHSLPLAQPISVRVPPQAVQSLHADAVWDASIRISDTICTGKLDVRGKRVVELGAGAGLPSLMAARFGAREVVLTDYDSPELVRNLERNREALGEEERGRLVVQGYCCECNPEARWLRRAGGASRRHLAALRGGWSSLGACADFPPLFRRGQHDRGYQAFCLVVSR